MLTRIDLRGRADADVRTLLPRAALDVGAALDVVRPVCEAVHKRGAAAIREATARYDGVAIDELRVPTDALTRALTDLHPDVRAALEEMIHRTRMVHEAQRPDPVTVSPAPGLAVTERWSPVGRVGLYVPGGLLAYPSSVVMNVVPAQVAGVGSIAVSSPPQREYDGLPHPSILAACALLGVDEIYRVGGAQAIAMFAYGADDCAPVDIVTGPGNVYVAAAKRLLRGVVGIDSEAGPTEIGILADESASPVYLAADLVAQAEHDELAACLLVTDSSALLDAVDAELEQQVAAARHRGRIEKAFAGQSAYVLVDDIDAGIRVVDAWAAEHLEVMTRDAAAVAARVTNAGAIFVGPYAPVSLGDYLAGSNHVLPTGGTARRSGGLSVHTFLRQVHVVEATEEALAGAARHVDALGGAEDLAAHVAAVRARIPLRPGTGP
jgi:histidinol dehydrogenase